MKFKRVYRPAQQWEERVHGMWSAVADRQAHLDWAIGFTGNHALYGSFMKRVVAEWPISCENALTDYSLNRRAWIGHAACALAHRCPEDIVRLAWGFLTDEQRQLANFEADYAIEAWEHTYAKDRCLFGDVGNPLLHRGNS